MLKNQTQKLIEQLTQFRQDLYDCFDVRQNTVMDLLDALASNTERPQDGRTVFYLVSVARKKHQLEKENTCDCQKSKP